MSDNFSVDHVALLTNNSKKLVIFYRDKLGFKKEKEEVLEAVIGKSVFGIKSDFKFIKLTSQDLIIEIFEPLSLELGKKLSESTGIHHWGLCVEDRDEILRYLKRKKVKIIKVRRTGNPVYFIEDPDGNRIEIRYRI